MGFKIKDNIKLSHYFLINCNVATHPNDNVLVFILPDATQKLKYLIEWRVSGCMSKGHKGKIKKKYAGKSPNKSSRTTNRNYQKQSQCSSV